MLLLTRFALLLIGITIRTEAAVGHDALEVPYGGEMPGLPTQIDFARQTRNAIAMLHTCQPGGVALAPLGGSRIQAFAELDIDTLVILDALRPGSPEGVRQEFTSNAQALRRSLQAAEANGSMSWWDVNVSYPVAQLLGRLKIEFGVEAVGLTYYMIHESDVPAFDGKLHGRSPRDRGDIVGMVGPEEPPLVVQLRFAFDGRSRQLFYIATQMRDDTQETPGWPMALLERLVPAGFTQMSVSADFLLLFSAYPRNGATLATQNLVDLLAPGSLTMIDFPRDKLYNTAQVIKGVPLVAMGGRADLEPWGFDAAATLSVDAKVFGYAGEDAGDEVRIYRRRGDCRVPATYAETTDLWPAYSWEVTLK